jgi:hypothetical protein
MTDGRWTDSIALRIAQGTAPFAPLDHAPLTVTAWHRATSRISLEREEFAS